MSPFIEIAISQNGLSYLGILKGDKAKSARAFGFGVKHDDRVNDFAIGFEISSEMIMSDCIMSIEMFPKTVLQDAVYPDSIGIQIPKKNQMKIHRKTLVRFI